MPRFDIITIGGAVKDFIFYTDQGRFFSTPENLTAQKMLGFEYGAKINPTESYQGLGGGAANSGIALARLGFKTAIITRVGKDAVGNEILARFKKEKINTNFVQIDGKNPSGFSLILSTSKKEREHVVFLDRGANNFFFFNPKSLARLRCKWFYVTSLSGKNHIKNLKAIFDFADKKNIKIAWNPGNFQLKAGKKILSSFLKKTHILNLNKDEAIELVLSGVKLGRKSPNYLNKPLYLLNILREWGPKIVVITDGKKGAWVYDGSNIYKQKILKSKIVDTTGVGDAFGSSFLAGLIVEKNDIKKALKWGVINAGSVTAEVGAQNGLLNRRELESKIG